MDIIPYYNGTPARLLAIGVPKSGDPSKEIFELNNILNTYPVEKARPAEETGLIHLGIGFALLDD